MNQSLSTGSFYDYPQQDASGATCIAQAWAKTPAPLALGEKQDVIERIKLLLKAKDAVIVAHYYVDGDIQDLAIQTGGFVSDSLEMARFG